MFTYFIPDPILFSLGAFSVRWYGLLLALGTLVGYVITRKLARERGVDLLKLDALVSWLLMGGIIGARIFDVLVFEWWYFKGHLWEIFAVWHGGLAFHGALLAGVVILIWYAKRHQLKILELLDVFAPGLAVGQAIGRWGNYFNQELFGLPTNLPWGIPIATSSRPMAFQGSLFFHPVFLYESIALVLVAAILWHWRVKLTGGRLFAAYLVLVGVIRFLLEFVRIDEQNIFLSLRAGFWVAGLTTVIGILIFFYFKGSIKFKKN